MNPTFGYPKPGYPLAPVLLVDLYRDPLKNKAGKVYPLDAAAWAKLPELKVAELGDWVFERTRAGLSSPSAPARRATVAVPEGATLMSLPLSVRARTVLHAAGVREVRDLAGATVHDLLQMRGGGILFVLELLVCLEGWSPAGIAEPPAPPEKKRRKSESDDSDEPEIEEQTPAAAVVRAAGGILSTRALSYALDGTGPAGKGGWRGVVALGAGLVALPSAGYEPVGVFLADYLDAAGPPDLQRVITAIQWAYPNAEADLVEDWVRRWAKVQQGVVSLR